MKYVRKIMSAKLHNFAGIQILNIKIKNKKYAYRCIVRMMVNNLAGRLKTIHIQTKQISKETECIVVLDLPIHQMMILQFALRLII